jgi:hypothetical protein
MLVRERQSGRQTDETSIVETRFSSGLCQTFKINTMEEIYYFEDWVNNMLNDSDYSEFELMCFEEHYQNLLDDEQNTENFLLWKETQTESE